MNNLTVAITCWNAEATIERCLKSLIKSDKIINEILVLDDGSTDSSVSIIKENINKNKKIKLIRHIKNKGVAASRSKLIHEARSKFVAFLDDDDEAHPERFDKQIHLIEKAEISYKTNLVACYCSREVISEENSQYMGAIGVTPPSPHGKMVALNILAGYKEPGYVFGPVGSGTLIARRETFLAVGDFDPNLRRTEDLDWAIRLSLMGGVFIGCPEPLIRQHVTVSHEKSNFKPLIDSFQLLIKYQKYLKAEKFYISSFIFQAAKFFYAKKKKYRYKFLLATLYAINKKLFSNLRGK
ncbi:glycosyltransferase family 2 protein [Thalassospira sp. NFXS8]|uniref:glycosyltransferase family 2 protein n=1 Tax=Thalassospira sp. NFXS8 TaxID=2819093 RepID=UPI0032DECBA9